MIIAPESPYFLVRPEDAVVVAGSDAVLECQVTGEPAPEVRWYREGSQVLGVQKKFCFFLPYF